MDGARGGDFLLGADTETMFAQAVTVFHQDEVFVSALYGFSVGSRG